MPKENLLPYMNSNNNKLEVKGHMGKTIVFSDKDDLNNFWKDYKSKSQMEDIFNFWKYNGAYDTDLVNFKDLIIENLKEKNILLEDSFSKKDIELKNLHKHIDPKFIKLDETEQNDVSVSFYDISKKLYQIYKGFIKNYISPLFNEPVYYQLTPTFRFHFPKQKGYNWEDRYHTDVMLGHPPYEFNIWLPFTKVYNSNSMRLMPLQDSVELILKCNHDFEIFAERVQHDKEFMMISKEKSSPLDMDYGSFIIFDPRCLHCTQYNQSEDTRISMDVRIILESGLKKYSRKYKTTGRKKMLFEPGHYYSEESV